jgi:hypothetical protein
VKTAAGNINSIRFRRFLRKSYAVFCSLHRHITIGQLSVDTNNSSLKTLKNRISEIFFANNSKNIDNEQFIEPVTIENIFEPQLQAIFAVSKKTEKLYFAQTVQKLLYKTQRIDCQLLCVFFCFCTFLRKKHHKSQFII